MLLITCLAILFCIFRFESNCCIAVKANRLKASIKNFRFEGMLRICLRPLLYEAPLIGAIFVSFVKDPVSGKYRITSSFAAYMLIDLLQA